MFYQKHVFFCTNQKDGNKKCCAQGDAENMWQYARERCKEEGLLADNQVRVSRAGCLGRCAEGPCVVIYPEGRWYKYQTKADIDAIIDGDVINNVAVTECLLP